MSSGIVGRDCSPSLFLRLPSAASKYPAVGNSRSCRRGHSSKVSFPFRSSQQLNRVNQHRLRTFLKNAATGEFSGRSLPTLRCRRGGSRKISTARAENEGVNGSGLSDDEKEEASPTGVDGRVGDGGLFGKGSDGGFAGKRNAFSAAISRFFNDFLRELKNETGFDSEVAKDRVLEKLGALREKSVEVLGPAKGELQNKLREASDHAKSVTMVFRRRYVPQFVNWNRIELWQDRKQWDAQRIGALVMYLLLFGAFLRGGHMIVTNPRANRKVAEELTEAFLESVVPEPNAANFCKLRKAMWREDMPKGVSLRKYLIGEDGSYQHDMSFCGEDPEEDEFENFDPIKYLDESDEFTAEEKELLKKEISASNSIANLEPIDAEERAKYRFDISEVIDEMDSITPEKKEELKKGIAEVKAMRARERSEAANEEAWAASHLGLAPKMNWKERVSEWESILRKASIKETLDLFRSKYVPVVSLEETKAMILKSKQDDSEFSKKMRAFWVARKWWKYRPKLPYTYALAKLENQEVKAAVYTEDLRKLYLKMKDGFPSEFVVDIPVDPYLYELLETSGIKLGVLHRSNYFYYGRILLALLPSLVVILYIRGVQYRIREKASEKIYDLLSMNRQHLILPEDAADKAKSQYKDVVLGGDIWQVIDEIMIYMRNPMKYYDRRVKLPRGILISGPPGTGKTLLARAIARESGLPFVFASGAEFVESSGGTGTDKVFDIFFTARANAPSFVFIDEIDALAGKNVKDDAERRATFEQLLSELDGEPEDTDVDRYAPRQAVILICATNRPDELDERLMRPGRIDREIYIGLPGEEERISIFEVHSQGKRVAKDVDFQKLVFRTIGYSGADIRNLINEAGIMAVRKGEEEISQQDLIEVLDKQLFEGMGVVLMDDEQKRAEQKVPEGNKRLLAVHEAGHVLLAHLFPHFDWHAFSHLLPGGSEAALSVFYPREEMLQLGYTTIGYIKMQMVVAHGGRCAEQLVYGDISDGGQDDLARISGMARELTISKANSRLGLLPTKWQDYLDAPKPAGEVELVPNEWDKPGSHIVNMSVELSEVFTREITKYADETEELAMTALSQNQHILEKLADVLLSKTKLSGIEAGEIIRSMNPILLPDFMHCDFKVDLKSFEEKVVPPKMRGRYEELNIYPAPLHRS